MNPPRTQSRWRTSMAALGPNFTWFRTVLALIAGGAHAASMAWPVPVETSAFALLGMRPGQPVWWLQLLGLGLLAGLLQGCRDQVGASPARTNWRLAALWGWLFGTAWLAGTFWWTFVAMHTYGGLPAILAALAVLVLAGLLALYYGAACGLFVALDPASRSFSAIIFAALWLGAELARGRWLTGFGWGASGYAHVDGPLAGFAPWLGLYGLCALSAWLVMTGVQWVRPAPACQACTWRERVLGLPAVLLLLTLPAVYRMEQPEMSKPAGTLSVTLLQGNIPQNEKFETGTGVPLALQWYAEQLQLSRTALVVAPETAIPVLPQQLPPAYWEALQQRFASGQQAALMGMPLGNYQAGYTNSVVGFKPGQAQPWRYDKHHLVPFGEFIPPLFKWFTAMMNIPLGDFNRGELGQAPFEWQGQRLAPNVCYENLFSEELGVLFSDPSRAPTIFVNVSNLAWFGNGQALDQHLQIARLRALEFERPFVLATNTGATAIVDHRGRIQSALARDTRAVLVGEVEGRTGLTPYAWWAARFGLWPYWLLVLGVILLAARQRLRKR